MVDQPSTRPDVTVGELTRHPDRVAAAALLAAIWGVPQAESPVPADLMAALTHAGGCVIGAWADDELVGVTIGLTGAPHSDRVYSYIAGVGANAAGRGVGRLLKLAQRDWARRRGARYLTWTYDPLIRRNGHFNLNRLGGRVTDFIPDYYPPMLDAVNAGDLPDRFVVEWDVDQPATAPAVPGAGAPAALWADDAGEPQLDRAALGAVADRPVLVWVPLDIEALRRGDPDRGRRWRLAARESFEALFASGGRPVAVDPGGHYVFVKGS